VLYNILYCLLFVEFLSLLQLFLKKKKSTQKGTVVVVSSLPACPFKGSKKQKTKTTKKM